MKKIFVSTPTFTGGSWVCVEDLLNQIKDDYKVLVTGFGSPRMLPGIEYKKIPYYSFEKIDPRIGRNIFFNFLFQLPIQLFNLFYFTISRPNLLISNGFTSLILILPIAKLFRVPVVVYYGSYLTEWFKNRYVRKIVKFGCKFVTFVFVNSFPNK